MRWRPPNEFAADEDGGETGSVTAEFAVMLPAVLIVLGLIIGGIMLSAHRIGLVGAAADIARLEARGDTQAANARAAELGDGVNIERQHRGELLCVALSSSPGTGPLSVIAVSARSCAALSTSDVPLRGATP